MKLRPVIIISIFLVALLFLGLSLPAQAAPSLQIQLATNTPLSDGRILYQVQANDNCIRISLLYGISVEQLLGLNKNINPDCSNLAAGELLLVGTGGPAAAATATPGPSPTPLPPTITPTPLAGTTEICVLIFNDINGDALRQADEPVIPDAAISVTEKSGKYSKTLQSAINPDPNAYPGTCFTDVPEGSYNIAVALPDNYNPTTDLNASIDLKAGDQDFVPFGAQPKNDGVSQTTQPTNGGGTSPLLGVIGGLLLLGGLGLGWYALRMRNPRSKLKQSGLLKR